MTPRQTPQSRIPPPGTRVPATVHEMVDRGGRIMYREVDSMVTIVSSKLDAAKCIVVLIDGHFEPQKLNYQWLKLD